MGNYYSMDHIAKDHMHTDMLHRINTNVLEVNSRLVMQGHFSFGIYSEKFTWNYQILDFYVQVSGYV